MSFKKTLLVQLCLTCALFGRTAQSDGARTSPPIASAQSAAAPNAATPEAPRESSLVAPSSREAEQRRVSLLAQNSTSGSTGLLHLTRPGSGAAGTFRVSALFDIFSGAGFLCNANAPCGTNTHDSADRAGTVLGLSVTPLGYLEAYASLHSAANYDNQHSPGVIDVLGNTSLGLKLFTPNPMAGVFSVGGLAELKLLNGSGSVGFSGKGTSFRFAVLGDFDLRKPSGDALPLHILTNVGYLADNSGALVEGTEASRGSLITRVERFGLAINRVDRFQTGLGLEAQLPIVRPFVEWNLEVPVNRQNYTCDSSKSSSGDRCLGNVSSFSALPSTLTFGARVSPLLKGLSATAAVDLGTSGTSTFLEELAPTLPWDLWLGVGYAFDIEEPKPVRVVVVQDRVAPPPIAPAALRIRGFVHEHGKETGIADAILHYRDRDITAMASGSDGRFISTDLEPGTYTFGIDAEGFKPGQCSVVVAAAPSTPTTPSKKAATAGTGPAAPAGAASTPSAASASDISYTDADCTLESLPSAGNVSGHVLDAVSGTPVAGATVELTDSLHRSLSLVTDSGGGFRFERVIPGTVTIDAASREYLFRAQILTLAARQDLVAELKLRKRPKFSRVVLTATELKINQPIHFDQDSAAIAADSESLLDEVADALGSNPRVTRIEIQGHTDNSGTPERNQSLSQARANSVLDWLSSHGIDSQRMSARGYGQDHPMSPNVTPQGHARNRRIQFMIPTQKP